MRSYKKYLIAVGVITIQGITYNVQFEYLFFIELIMLGSVFIGQNFFEPLYEYERRISLLLKKRRKKKRIRFVI